MTHSNQKAIGDIHVGDTASFSFQLTSDVHDNFKTYIQDTSPVHNDDDFAKKAGFKKKIAYGFNVAAYLSRFYGNYLPGGSSICLKQEISFIKPVYIGDTLTVTGEVASVSSSLKIVHITNRILNQAGEVCVTGQGVVRVVI